MDPSLVMTALRTSHFASQVPTHNSLLVVFTIPVNNAEIIHNFPADVWLIPLLVASGLLGNAAMGSPVDGSTQPFCDGTAHGTDV